MGLLVKAAERRAQVINPVHPGDPSIASIFGGGGQYSGAGISVNPRTAAGEDTLFAAERFLSETVAALPLNLMRHQNPRGSQVAVDHWLQRRLHKQPNRYMAKYRFWRLLLNHLFYRGNFYVLIEPSLQMAPFEFWPLHPDRIKLMPFVQAWDDESPDWQEPFYRYTTPKNGVKDLRFGQVLHVAFLPGEDGFTGRSVISYQVETIGRALAAERYQSKLSANNARPAAVLKHKKNLSPAAQKLLKEDWNNIYGADNGVGGVAILQEDMDFSTVSMTNQDAQAVAMLQLNAESMARIARVPQHKVGIMTRATYSNIEQQAIEAVQDAILPLCVNIEDEIYYSCLTEEEKKSLFPKFNISGLMRGDFLSRQQGLEIMRRNGVVDGNDWADYEDMNPFVGGDKRYVPLNWMDLNAPPPAAKPDPFAPAPRLLPLPREMRSLEMMTRLRSAHQPIVEDAARRLLRREADAMDRLFKKHAMSRSLSDFVSAVDGYYVEFRDALTSGMTPALSGLAHTMSVEAMNTIGADETDVAALDGFVAACVAASTANHISESRAQLMGLVGMEPDAMMTAADSMFRQWRNDRPAKVGQSETARISNAVSRFTWQAAGIQDLQWRTGPACADCPDCGAMDGMTVGIRDEFAPGVLHPPMEDGCDCQIMPGGMQ